jgi:DNA-binding CsgD family transcriptional regulator
MQLRLDGEPTLMDLRDGTAAPGADPQGGRCRIEVRAETLREALTSVAARSGWVADAAPGTERIVVRDVPAARAREQFPCGVVLVVDPTPVAARAGMTALAAGTVAAVISSDQPSDLTHALRTLAGGWGSVPMHVVASAARLPDLTERQAIVMRAVLAGQSTKDMARGLYLSGASVKRELAILYRTFGLPNRLALAAFAAELGFSPKPLRP